MNVTPKYSAERWSTDPRGYIADRIKDLPMLADQLGYPVWRNLNSQTTCDSHVDFGAVGYPAYFAPGMFSGPPTCNIAEVNDFQIAPGSPEEAAMEGLALLNLSAFGYDLDGLTLVKLELNQFIVGDVDWARFSKVPE